MKFRIWNDLDPIDALDVREGKPFDPQGRRHDARASDVGPAAEPGGSVRREQTNLTGLVLSFIEARFCKKICVGKLSPRSTQCTPLHRSQSSHVRFKMILATDKT